jgi:hypothetical protein
MSVAALDVPPLVYGREFALLIFCFEHKAYTVFALDEVMSRQTRRKLAGFAATLLTLPSNEPSHRLSIATSSLSEGIAAALVHLTPDAPVRYYALLVLRAEQRMIFTTGNAAATLCQYLYREFRKLMK